MEFYSSREERVSQASSTVKKAYEKRANKNFFKKNPHIKILLFDLIIVLLFAVVIIPLLMKITQKVRIEHYNVESKAFIFEDKLLITIKLESSNRKKNKSLATQDLKIDILKEDGQEVVSKTVVFPKNPEELFYITFKLEDNDNLDKINIKLETIDYHRKYKLDIQR